MHAKNFKNFIHHLKCDGVLVYLDDEQVTDVLCRKRDLNSNLRLENPSSVLAEGFSRGHEFLYIVIEEAPDQEVISSWRL